MIIFKRFKIKSITKKLKAMQQYRVHNQPNPEMIAKEINLCHQLSDIYSQLKNNKKFPFSELMRWEALRASTNLEDAKAQYQLGCHLLEEAKFRQELEENGIFSSASNQRLLKQLYEESLAYLHAAEQLGHVEAKRMYGLCYINGWGVELDRNKGFELVVESIEQENSWDKVPQIFAAIGLNKPEFFAALMKHRGNKL